MAITWAELEAAEPELAAFGRERLEGQVVFQASIRRDGSPRVHPVSPWFGAGQLVLCCRAGSPKVTEFALDDRYALHSPMDNHDGEGGECMVRGTLHRIDDEDPATAARPFTSTYPLAFYACDVQEIVATTYAGDTPIYRRFRA
jgi:hypothetical protein